MRPHLVRQYLTNFGFGLCSLRFQFRKRLALSLNVGAVRPSIGQSLANDALCQFVRAVGIVHAKRNAIVMAKIKFREVAVQMLLGAMLVGALHAAFEN
jgi:hypothetical protein